MEDITLDELEYLYISGSESHIIWWVSFMLCLPGKLESGKFNAHYHKHIYHRLLFIVFLSLCVFHLCLFQKRFTAPTVTPLGVCPSIPLPSCPFPCAPKSAFLSDDSVQVFSRCTCSLPYTALLLDFDETLEHTGFALAVTGGLQLQPLITTTYTGGAQQTMDAEMVGLSWSQNPAMPY